MQGKVQYAYSKFVFSHEKYWIIDGNMVHLSTGTILAEWLHTHTHTHTHTLYNTVGHVHHMCKDVDTYLYVHTMSIVHFVHVYIVYV